MISLRVYQMVKRLQMSLSAPTPAWMKTMKRTVASMKSTQEQLYRKIARLEQQNDDMLNQQVLIREICAELGLDPDTVTGAEVLKSVRAMKQDNKDLRCEVVAYRGG